MRRWILLALLIGGCDGSLPTDTDDLDTGTQDEGCPQVDIWFDGPEAPRVGDTWSVLLKCEGAVMTGPMVLRFDDVEFATIDSNEVTYAKAGTAQMRVQVGGYIERMDVTVTE